MEKIIKRTTIIIACVLATMVILTGCNVSKSLVFFNSIDEAARIQEHYAELEARRERLEQLIAEEGQRRSDLEDEEAYVQKRKYLEEKVKSIGYVYPDEIIFREDD